MKIRLIGNDALIYRFRRLINIKPVEFHSSLDEVATGYFELTDDEFHNFLMFAERTKAVIDSKGNE